MPALKIVIGNKTYSSWSLRGWLAVAHSGLVFEEELLPLDTPEFHERIGALSPSRTVPALLHGDAVVWDSLAIIDYCAHLAPEHFWWPKETKAYGYARSITAEMHTSYMGLRSHAPMNLRGNWSGLELGEAVKADVEKVQNRWSTARTRFGSGGEFLFGNFGAADMMFAPVVARLLTYSIEVDDICRAYMDAVRNHPLVDAWYKDAAGETDIVEMDEIPADATRLG
ncbi:glutathione S-transferase family protein [Kordiimonas aestuarii]|uniref:glutathione S-transferase family protein n=1 Tax=Kordiimonas aestuarii TaxID=1005925 RepID=UPI0021CEDA61|nr:glutathione S-transferase family protein [Kordiimonas aestuarii]